jgi:pyruvate, water dikinase
VIAAPLVEATSPEQFGGKAVELGAAIRGGLPVPGGFALSVAAVDAVKQGDAAACALVERMYTELGGGPVAARSSAVGEDGQHASFAGQHVTKLNVVSMSQLHEAIIEVRESGFVASAVAYRHRSGVAGPPRIAVVVQRLVIAELAGVLFTRCPVSGRDERVIEAARGLGESVVAGLINPERVRIDRTGRVIERTAPDQDLMIVARAGGGTEEQPIADRRAAVLQDHHVRALHELALRVETVFGNGGHDLEWAFAGDALHLLQRRPITR